MMSGYEKNYIESINRGPNSINISKNMGRFEKNLEIIRYIKEAIRNQPIYFGEDIDKCDAFLDGIKYEYEIEKAWIDHEKEFFNKEIDNE